jgi:hypothetical protein
MKIAFALYAVLTWVAPPDAEPPRQILDLHKTYQTEKACESACRALENKELVPKSLYSQGRLDYFCIQVPGE